jgi:hypothetical protein
MKCLVFQSLGLWFKKKKEKEQQNPKQKKPQTQTQQHRPFLAKQLVPFPDISAGHLLQAAM